MADTKPEAEALTLDEIRNIEREAESRHSDTGFHSSYYQHVAKLCRVARAALPKPVDPLPERKPSVHDELVARLRNTPNWKREAFGGSWKEGFGEKYDRAPFEAADLIEKLDDELEAALAGILTDDFLENLRLLRLWMLGYDYDMEQIFKAIKPLVDQLPKPLPAPDLPPGQSQAQGSDAAKPVSVAPEDEALFTSLRDRLFAHIEHGDEKHRNWLKNELDVFFREHAESMRRRIAGLRSDNAQLQYALEQSEMRYSEKEAALAACRDKTIEECATWIERVNTLTPAATVRALKSGEAEHG